jgi:hypothetical protein
MAPQDIVNRQFCYLKQLAFTENSDNLYFSDAVCGLTHRGCQHVFANWLLVLLVNYKNVTRAINDKSYNDIDINDCDKDVYLFQIFIYIYYNICIYFKFSARICEFRC